MDSKNIIEINNKNSNILISQINEIHALGYSIPQYCIDNEIKNIIIYTEEQDWNIIEPIALSFRIHRKINLKAKLSKLPFKHPYYHKNHLGSFETTKFNISEISPDDTIISIQIYENKSIKKKIISKGAKYLALPKLIKNTMKYVIHKRSIYNFIVRNPDIPVIFFSKPNFPRENLSDWENYIKKHTLTQGESIYFWRNMDVFSGVMCSYLRKSNALREE